MRGFTTYARRVSQRCSSWPSESFERASAERVETLEPTGYGAGSMGGLRSQSVRLVELIDVLGIEVIGAWCSSLSSNYATIIKLSFFTENQQTFFCFTGGSRM